MKGLMGESFYGVHDSASLSVSTVMFYYTDYNLLAKVSAMMVKLRESVRWEQYQFPWPSLLLIISD